MIHETYSGSFVRNTAFVLTILVCVLMSNLNATADETERSSTLKNPSPKSSNGLHAALFVNPYGGRNLHKFGVDKIDYKIAIKYAESGYGHDAFMASMAYWSGHYKQGKKNVQFGAGRNKEKSLKYLHLASDLGWPEASYMLYECYRYRVSPRNSYQDWRQVYDRPQRTGGLILSYDGCIHTNANWDGDKNNINGFVLPEDNKKARFYLERAASQGEYFDENFKLLDEKLPELDRLSSRITMIIAQLRFQSLMYVAAEWAKKTGQKSSSFFATKDDLLMYQQSFSSCPDLYNQFLVKSAFDERVACGKANADSRFCPGTGYKYLGELLEACMMLAPNENDWDFYFNERLKYFHPYYDGRAYGNFRLLNHAKDTYIKQNKPDKASWVQGLMFQADQNAASLAGKWDYDRSKLNAKNASRYQAEQQEKEDLKRRSEENWKRQEAKQKEWDAQAQRELDDWKIGDSIKPDRLQQIQDNTMRDIYDAQQRQQLGSSGVGETVIPSNSNSGSVGEGNGAMGNEKAEHCVPPPMAEFCAPDTPKPCNSCSDYLPWKQAWDNKCASMKAETANKLQAWERNVSQTCKSKYQSSDANQESAKTGTK